MNPLKQQSIYETLLKAKEMQSRIITDYFAVYLDKKWFKHLLHAQGSLKLSISAIEKEMEDIVKK